MNSDSKITVSKLIAGEEGSALKVHHYDDGGVGIEPDDLEGFPITILSPIGQRVLIESLQASILEHEKRERAKPPIFTIEVDVDPNDLLAILHNALRSPVCHWRVESRSEGLLLADDVHWLKDPARWKHGGKDSLYPFVEGGRLAFIEEDGIEEHIMDADTIRRGVRILSSEYPAQWSALRGIGADDDANDKFLQCCLFGEVRYS